MKTDLTPVEQRERKQLTQYLERGWCFFPEDPTLLKWVNHAKQAAKAELLEEKNLDWIRCAGSWFVGVNALENNDQGQLQGGPLLGGSAVDFIQRHVRMGGSKWDQAQISVCYPNYPKQSADESDSGYNYRVKRDAAHVDGLLPEGPNRRRHLREYHQFVLGIPMFEHHAASSPLVVWEGSHHIVKQTFSDIYSNAPLATWGDLDVTDMYQRMRKRIFETCRRVVVTARPGESYLIHRLALHGIAPWKDVGQKDEYRMICYFRPPVSNSEDWLTKP